MRLVGPATLLLLAFIIMSCDRGDPLKAIPESERIVVMSQISSQVANGRTWPTYEIKTASVSHPSNSVTFSLGKVGERIAGLASTREFLVVNTGQSLVKYRLDGQKLGAIFSVNNRHVISSFVTTGNVAMIVDESAKCATPCPHRSSIAAVDLSSGAASIVLQGVPAAAAKRGRPMSSPIAMLNDGSVLVAFSSGSGEGPRDFGIVQHGTVDKYIETSGYAVPSWDGQLIAEQAISQHVCDDVESHRMEIVGARDGVVRTAITSATDNITAWEWAPTDSGLLYSRTVGRSPTGDQGTNCGNASPAATWSVLDVKTGDSTAVSDAPSLLAHWHGDGGVGFTCHGQELLSRRVYSGETFPGRCVDQTGARLPISVTVRGQVVAKGEDVRLLLAPDQ